MDEALWRDLTTRWNRVLLDCLEDRQPLPVELLAAGWPGHPGALEEQLARTSSRRRTEPCLRFSNGWQGFGRFSTNPGLWPVEDIDWYRVRHNDLIDAWTRGALSQLSSRDDV